MSILSSLDFWVHHYERSLQRFERARDETCHTVLAGVNNAGRDLHWRISEKPTAEPEVLALMDQAVALFQRTVALITERNLLPACQHYATAATVRAESVARHRQDNVRFEVRLAALLNKLFPRP